MEAVDGILLDDGSEDSKASIEWLTGKEMNRIE